jgi:hypothetical protein
MDIHEYVVPFARVLGAYWESKEREFLCNLSGIPGTLIKKGDRVGYCPYFGPDYFISESIFINKCLQYVKRFISSLHVLLKNEKNLIMSIGGVSNSGRLMDVGLSQSVERQGRFQVQGGHVDIQRAGGKIKITETITKENNALEDKEMHRSAVKEFKTHKKAMKWLKTHNLSEGESVVVVKEYKSSKKAEAWLERNALSPQERELANAMEGIEKMENFGSCTRPQQTYIKEYARQIIEGGDKPEFALQVCQSMMLLYKEGMESLMPDAIDFRNIVENGNEMRTQAIGQLTEIMAANGGNYMIMQRYLREQQLDSNSKESQEMRNFLMAQRQNPSEERFLSSPVMQDPEYAKTVAIYKAFTAIALNKANFAGRDPQNHTCTVYRGMPRDVLERNYHDYDQVQNGDNFTIKHSTLESTSIGNPIRMFNEIDSDTHTLEVPFSRVFVAYFMSSEMCGGMGRHEHEFICDLGDIPAKIKHNLTEEDIAGYEQATL